MPYSVGLDVRMIRHSGIGTYLRGLLEGFRSAGIREPHRPALFGPAGVADDYSDFTSRRLTPPIYSISEQAAYLSAVSQCRLWHAPHYNVPVLKGKARLVVTIHDIIHWIFRDRFLNPVQAAYAGFMLNRAVGISDRIIAVSENTKNDLIEHFKAPADKITVIYEGVGNAYRMMPPEELSARFKRLSEKYRLPENFFLYVGLMKPHKNVLWLVELFRRLKASGRLKSSLVLVGRKDKKYPKEFEGLRDLQTDGDVIHIPAIEFPELLVLYNRAVALVHPSLYEGFGLTVLEAMKCGTPVITTKAASLAEVAGGAAVLVNPSDPSEMSEALIGIESDVRTRDILRAQGLERVKKFQWEDTARQTAEVYRRVLGS
ncbi:MAG: Glycogen synthase [Candidatus Omnitrophica bacterium ADurb.Bin277]|nr:MAG: Glycogen synthase [Candidatus Omnitrophica bacterium ADurb.Bin277]